MSHSKLLFLAAVALPCLASIGCDRDHGATDDIGATHAAFSKGAGKVNVTVAAVEEGMVTVRYPDGRLQRLQVESAAAIKIGMASWCEEDCGRGLSTPAGYVRVLRVR